MKWEYRIVDFQLDRREDIERIEGTLNESGNMELEAVAVWPGEDRYFVLFKKTKVAHYRFLPSNGHFSGFSLILEVLADGRRGSQVVRQRSAKPLFASSILARASNLFFDLYESAVVSIALTFRPRSA